MRQRRLRQDLRELIAELRVWTDLLRNKALALRAIAAASFERREPTRSRGGSGRNQQGASGASLDTRALARALAAAGPSSRPRRPAGRPRPVLDDIEGVLHEAQAVWETVADPHDRRACGDLADVADTLAARLENCLHDARDQLRASRDEFARSLTRARREAAPHDR
jgi:hypothetical protein